MRLPQLEDIFLEFDKQIAAEEESGSTAKTPPVLARNDSLSVNEVRYLAQMLRSRLLTHPRITRLFQCENAVFENSHAASLDTIPLGTRVILHVRALACYQLDECCLVHIRRDSISVRRR